MRRKVSLKPYPCTLHLCIKDELDGNAGGMTWSDGSNIYVEYERDSYPLFVVHESMHVLQELEEYIDCQLDKESQAYLLQYIVDTTLKVLR